MNMKCMLAAVTVFLYCNAFAQTSAGIDAYNSSPLIGREDTHQVSVPNAEKVNSDRHHAERGNAAAQFRLALRYDLGHGVPQDLAESVKWLRKAAAQNYVKAQYNLGCMYADGHGVPQDHAEAANWFRKAAGNGYASAQKNLGAQYGLGLGVPQSDIEAFIWSSIAASSGDQGAISNRDFAAEKLSPADLEMARLRGAELGREIQQKQQ